jgi:predicted ABC-type ATPase
MKKEFYIISGCNGSGKTTLAFKLLPNFLEIYNFVNADEIAKGLSPLKPETANLKASKLLIERTQELMNEGQSFAVETTLSAKFHLRLIAKCRALGYTINLLFIYLPSEEAAIKRVKKRVAQGGHNIAEHVIRRRYNAGLRNLHQFYMNQVDNLRVVDGSPSGEEEDYPVIAKKDANSDLVVYNDKAWQKILASK